MPMVHMMRGLPASGKTQYVTRQCRGNPRARIVSYAKLATMLDPTCMDGDSEMDPSLEATVLGLRDELIQRFMRSGLEIYLDDMNLEPSHESRVRELINRYNAEIQSADNPYAETYSLDVRRFDHALDDLIALDLARPNSIGEKRMRKLWRYYTKLQNNPEWPGAGDVIGYLWGQPSVIVCDIDGFLSDEDGELNIGAYELVRRFCTGTTPAKLVVMTTRDSSQRQEVSEWLFDHQVPTHMLLMRHLGDQRPDIEVKHEMFNLYLRPCVNVRLVVESDPRTADLWTNRGIFTLRVE